MQASEMCGLADYHFIDLFRRIRGAGRSDRDKAIAAAMYLATTIEQARFHGIAEGMERAAVIAEHPDRLDGPAYSCCEQTVDCIATAIRAAKGTGDER